MIDPSLIKEFAIGVRPQDEDMSSERSPSHNHDSNPSKIRDIRVDQNWVDRAKMFADYYFQVVTIDEVDRQYRASEYDDFQLFLNVNSLHYFEDHYVKMNVDVEVLKRSTVESCYAKAKALKSDLMMQCFLEIQGIQVAKNVYFRVKSKFPKTKLLEILTGLKLAEMSDNDGLLTVDLLDQLFQSRETSLTMMLACYVSNFGAVMTTDGKLLVADSDRSTHSLDTTWGCWKSRLTFTNPQSALSLGSYPIGLVLNRDYLKVLEEWIQMTVDYLTKSINQTDKSVVK